MNAAEISIGAAVVGLIVWVVALTLTLRSERRRADGEAAGRRREQLRCIRLERRARADKQAQRQPDTMAAFPRELLAEPRELN